MPGVFKSPRVSDVKRGSSASSAKGAAGVFLIPNTGRFAPSTPLLGTNSLLSTQRNTMFLANPWFEKNHDFAERSLHKIPHLTPAMIKPFSFGVNMHAIQASRLATSVTLGIFSLFHTTRGLCGQVGDLYADQMSFALDEMSLDAGAEEDVARPSRWVGEVRRNNVSWIVEISMIQIDQTSNRVSVSVTIPSYWRSGIQAVALRDGGRWQVDSIQGLGNLEIEFRSPDIRLRVRNGPADGATGILSLVGSKSELFTRSVRFGAENENIAGQIIFPKREGRVPGVVIVPGAGNSSIEANPEYRFWGDFLAARGFAVLLFDKRGSGGSTGDWREVGFEPRAADLASGIRLLAYQPEVDSSNIATLSFSQGGWVALAAASQGAPLSQLIQVSTPTTTPFEADLYPIRNSGVAVGMTADQWDRYLAVWEFDVRTRAAGDTNPLWDSLVTLVAATNNEIGALANPYTLGTRGALGRLWYGKIAGFDPTPILDNLRIPVYWIYGEADTQSDVAVNLGALSQFDAQGTLLESQVFPGAGHGIAVAIGSDPPVYVSPPGFFKIILRRLFAFSGCLARGPILLRGCHE